MNTEKPMAAEVLTNEKVEAFWDKNLCGSHFIQNDYLSPHFFADYRSFRYKKTHHLDIYMDWASATGRDVLEIGLGIGADATRWAQYAKNYTGIDLTTEAVNATKKHLALLGLETNSHVIRQDVEKMVFPDESFDIIYSYGVLHHTSNIEAAFREICRVLKRDGQLIIMLYSKASFNYWIRIQVYFRLRFLIENMSGRLGLRLSETWQLHIDEFRRQGWKYWSWRNFPHHCTDGPQCQVANAYYLRQIRSLLSKNGLVMLKSRKAHFPLGGRYPKLERFIGKYIGFHQIVWARKK